MGGTRERKTIWDYLSSPQALAPEVSAERGSVSSPRLCKQQQTCVSLGRQGHREENISRERILFWRGFCFRRTS